MARRLPLLDQGGRGAAVPAVVPAAEAIDERRSAALRAIELPLRALDTLWLQLTGTLCNIACRHCFIACGPQVNRVPMMTRARIDRLLADAVALGVRAYYVTGGEPLLHPAFYEICEQILRVGPLTVLTNGVLIDGAAARRLRELFDGTRYSFDLRVSLDGMTAAQNDPVRGRGTFAQACAGLQALSQVGLAPVITVVEHDADLAGAASRAAFLSFARELGLRQPRVKFLPLLRLGREPRRTRGYGADEVVGALDADVGAGLQCGSGRLATEDHILTCPLLLDAPEARLGHQLADGLAPIRLRWAACHTCVAEGLSCLT